MSEAIVNIDALPLESGSVGTRFGASKAAVGKPLGLKGVGANLYVVPPGRSAVPFHRHHTSDELFVVLSGSGEYRIGDRRLPFRAGDCLGAPAGGDAHQIFNTGTEPLRYLAISNNTTADVVEYVDSGRIRVDVGASGFHEYDATFGQGGKLTPFDYWEGEDTGEDKP
jgi:uncharacterized cupin superfamily protein